MQEIKRLIYDQQRPGLFLKLKPTRCDLAFTCAPSTCSSVKHVCSLFVLQLVANAVLFATVNLSGVFVRILTERTQRKVFLQARNCIEERLRLEDENEKQVRREASVDRGKRRVKRGERPHMGASEVLKGFR